MNNKPRIPTRAPANAIGIPRIIKSISTPKPASPMKISLILVHTSGIPISKGRNEVLANLNNKSKREKDKTKGQHIVRATPEN